MKTVLLSLALFLALTAQSASGQDVAPAPLPPGLSLTVQQLDASGQPTGPTDTRSVRMIALHVPAGKPASSFVAAGRFRATWTGNLNLKLREKYGFLAFGRGTLTVTIDGKEVLKTQGEDLSKPVGEEVRLKKGANAVTVVYDSPADGDATVRLYWQQKTIHAEPVPPTVLSHDAAAKDVHDGDLARAGRMLVANLRCVKCHSIAPGFDRAKNVGGEMPELAMDAPSFQDIGQRLRRDWMVRWIDDPQSMRPGAHMPRVFKDGTAGKPDARAVDVAAYLSSLGAAGAGAPGPAADAETVKAGGKLYASLFCVACHSQPNAPPDADKGRIPHRNVAAKFTSSGLKAYLLNPEAHYAWNPMPNFRLSEAEATALAAFLTDKAQPAAQVGEGGDAKKGEALVASAGCYNCHSAGAPATATVTSRKGPEFAALTADKWTRGCLAEDPASAKDAPHYTLTPQDREALRAFAATDRSSLTRDTADEFSTRQWAAMRCSACHARDVEPAGITTALGDEVMDLYKAYFPDVGAVPAPAAAAAHAEGEALAPDQRALPLMTWAGEKLHTEWSASFIHGDVKYKPRPYLRARMPAFPARAAGLAQGLSAEHGFPFTSDPNPAPDPALVPLGQRLIAQAGGFSCVQCHSVAQRPPLAPFEAPSVNFAYVSQRLRKTYYDRWMWNPIRVDPGTKMPQFGDFEGNTAIKDVLGGDAAKQYDAIWNYLLQGKDITPAG